MTSITIFFCLIPSLAAIFLIVSFLLAPHRPNKDKDSQFECGFSSFTQMSRSPFNISFFVYALLFLLFDLEILLVYPYVVSASYNYIYGLIVMLLFFILLTIGFVFELGKKALQIDSRQSDIPDISFKGNLPKPHALAAENKLHAGIDQYILIFIEVGEVIINFTLESDFMKHVTSIISKIHIPYESIAKSFVSLTPYHMLNYPEGDAAEVTYKSLNFCPKYFWNTCDANCLKSNTFTYDLLWNIAPSLSILAPSVLYALTFPTHNNIRVFMVNTTESNVNTTQDVVMTDDESTRETVQRLNADYDSRYSQIFQRITRARDSWASFWSYVNVLAAQGVTLEINDQTGDMDIWYGNDADQSVVQRADRLNTQANNVIGQLADITRLMARNRYTAWLIQMHDPTFMVSEEIIMHEYNPILEQTRNLYNIFDFNDQIEDILKEMKKSYYENNPDSSSNTTGKRDRDNQDPDVGSSTKRLKDLSM